MTPNLDKMGNMTTRQRITMLAREKSVKLDLSNHKTGWNALCKLWDGNQWCQERLKMMGYGRKYRSTSAGENSTCSTVRRVVCLCSYTNGSRLEYRRCLQTQTLKHSDFSRFYTEKHSARPLYSNDKTWDSAPRDDQDSPPRCGKFNDRWTHQYDPNESHTVGDIRRALTIEKS